MPVDLGPGRRGQPAGCPGAVHRPQHPQVPRGPSRQVDRFRGQRGAGLLGMHPAGGHERRDVELEAVVPSGSPPNRVTVTALEVDSFAGSWSVTAFAICGPSTTFLQVVSASTSSSSTSPKEANVRCPSGLALYGTGFAIHSGNGTVLVHDVLPGISSSPRSLTVRATARPGFTPFWSLDAFGICANPATTMRIVLAQTALDSTATKSVNEVCPSGTRPHGVGAQTLSENPGNAVDGRVVLQTMAALASTVGSAGAAENGSVSTNWRLQVQVICAS
jgi:hypothetical protein